MKTSIVRKYNKTFNIYRWLSYPRESVYTLIYSVIPLLLILFIPQACLAEDKIYLTKDQALDLVLGEECNHQYTPKENTLELEDILKRQGLFDINKKTWHFFLCTNKNINTGYALIDSEIGKHLPITYIVGISPLGKVTAVEIMVFREVYGWEVKESKFLKQFKDKDLKGDLKIGSGLTNITGATLSSQAISRGVKRALIIWNYFFNK